MFERFITNANTRKIGLRVQGCRKVRAKVISDIMPIDSNDTLLDVGCGWGSSMFEFVNKVTKVVGIDVQFNLIEECKKVLKSKEEKLLFVNAGGTYLPFKDKTFSRVMCLDVIEHIDDHKLLLTELHRVLDNGYLVISTPNSEMPDTGRNWIRFLPRFLRRRASQHDYPYDQAYGHKREGYSTNEIRSLLEESNFKIVKHEYAYKGIINSLDNILWETMLYRIGTVIIFPLYWLDRFYKGIGAGHVILAKKI